MPRIALRESADAASFEKRTGGLGRVSAGHMRRGLQSQLDSDPPGLVAGEEMRRCAERRDYGLLRRNRDGVATMFEMFGKEEGAWRDRQCRKIYHTHAPRGWYSGFGQNPSASPICQPLKGSAPKEPKAD